MYVTSTPVGISVCHYVKGT